MARALSEALGVEDDLELSFGRFERIRGSLAARVRTAAGALVVLAPPTGALEGRILLDIDAAVLASLGQSPLTRLRSAVERVLASLGTARCIDVVVPGDPLADLGTSGEISLLPLALRLGQRRGTARLHLPDAALDAFEAHPSGPTTMDTAFATIPLEIGIARGLMRLTASELLGLGVGDVLLPDATFAADSPLGRLPTGSRIDLALTLTDGSLRLRSIEHRLALRRRGPEDIVMNQGPERLGPLHSAEVELSVEVGRLTLPLGELLELRPGDVLASLGPSTARVQIRAGEALVARGELVEVEGELGVRITELDGRQSTIA